MRAGDTLRSCNGVAFPIITAFAAETGSGELDAATLVAAMQTTDLRALFLRTAGEPTEAAAAVELARDGAILSDTQVAERIAAAARESDAGVVAFLQLMLSAVLAKVASASQASPLVLGFARVGAARGGDDAGGDTRSWRAVRRNVAFSSRRRPRNVSVLLFIVTFYANHAHNLTRSP